MLQAAVATMRPSQQFLPIPDRDETAEAAERAGRVARRRAELAVEALRLDRRRAVAEAVARRCEPGHHRLDPDCAGALRLRLLRRITALRLQFHRTIDALVMAGGFDEAIVILRARAPHPPA